ncbi:MAG: UDP-N-acetylmuramate dehydrogenase [Oscillospiraceae bacterium]|nr:UDP-N-acetylmuramate dehydrogenase [Oscillospiraceae bacterium]
MNTILDTIRNTLPDVSVTEQEPMKAHCSFRTGGPAAAFLVPEDEGSMLKLLAVLSENEIPFIVLGNGTNVVFRDESLPYCIISTEKLQEISLTEEGYVSAQAGAALSRVATFAYENSLTGMEFASGIPGSAGGGVLMNAGAYGGELKDIILSVRCCEKNGKYVQELPAEQCDFRYRHSLFQSGDYVILGAVFRLERGEKSGIAAKMKELNARRREKQPLDLPSAGSAFKRPEGHYAAALIEQCGLKGTAVGGAQVSEKHAGFIVNTGTATSADLEALLTLVSDTVKERTGIELQREIILFP